MGENGLFATINNTDLKNSKINEDGSFSTTAIDPYHYETWKKQDWIHSGKDYKEKGKILVKNLITATNNRAKEQQDLGQLDPYILSSPIHITKEELEEILRRYGKKY